MFMPLLLQTAPQEPNLLFSIIPFILCLTVFAATSVAPVLTVVFLYQISKKLDKLIENTKEVNYKRDMWNIYYRNDERFWETVEGYGKSKVSFTDDWESCLCNLMYIYRAVNWNNEMIMIIGG